MNAKTKNRVYFEILDNAGLPLDLSYWELNWDETDEVRKYADACNIKPKAGATKARTLWERAQKGRPF